MPDVADELRESSAAVRLHWTVWTNSKALDGAHKAEVAERFQASFRAVGASKKLFDSRNEHFRSLVTLKSEITALWHDSTLPYVEPGVRLIRRSLIPTFDERMTEYQGRFSEKVDALVENYDAIKAEAKKSLGRLYNEADYPSDLRGKFGFSWDFPSVEPPQYLLQLNPRLYEQEQQRVRARFEAAIGQAEQGFAAQLGELTAHLAERLKPGADGTKKVFRDSAVENFKDFFEKFRGLSVRSSGDLDALVGAAEAVLTNVTPEALRKQADVRLQVEAGLGQIRERLDQLVVSQPRRAWRRSGGAPDPTPHQHAAPPGPVEQPEEAAA